jgi:ribose transport system permease protein
MLRRAVGLINSQQSGLIGIILALGVLLTAFAGSHPDQITGLQINNFLNASTLMQTVTDASFFAIMAVGATMVIITGGIDLSVGSIYALSGVSVAMTLRAMGDQPATTTVLVALGVSLAIGLACGLLNGLMVCYLNVHPFIVTLGTMWVYRGIAFVTSKAESIVVPHELTGAIKANLGLRPDLYPVPTIVMVLVMVLGAIYLQRSVAGRHVFAVGGNVEASRYAGLRIGNVLTGVYTISGLCAGIAAFVGTSYYGAASCGDATGYELYVIASAVVGGASLQGGRGSALGAMLGAVLIVLIRQSIRTLHLDQNYEWIIIGCATIIAVVLDRFSARLGERRLAAPKSRTPAST